MQILPYTISYDTHTAVSANSIECLWEARKRWRYCDAEIKPGKSVMGGHEYLLGTDYDLSTKDSPSKKKSSIELSRRFG